MSTKNGNVNKEVISILTEPIDPEVLKRMPEWFRKLREAYQKKAGERNSCSDINEQQVWIVEGEFIKKVKLLIKHLRPK